MRNHRRLHVVVARQPGVVVHGVPQQRRTRRFRDGNGTPHRVEEGRRRRLAPRRCREQPEQRDGRARPHAGFLAAGWTLTIFTAHFLKSVWNEIGSVASSVTLLINWLASNHGTKMSPRGGLLRPRVSTRVRTLPRREAISISTPRRTPSAAASSGCM